VNRQLVFGYGSLPAAEGGVPCRLRDHRRGWEVAMDNRETIPGYKVYVDPETGERPPVHVAYLSITPHPGEHVDGYAFPVDDEQLTELDGRERNYDRRDVSTLVDADGKVWAYVGSEAGRRRLRHGRRRGRAVVSHGYLERVQAAFGHVHVPHDLSVRKLLRRDVRP
jgi:gamma-glutamylcyclotransferase (GGCT)/AIG2-like uncharacterized protein YtfP